LQPEESIRFFLSRLSIRRPFMIRDAHGSLDTNEAIWYPRQGAPD
jgi:hypothetical protein